MAALQLQLLKNFFGDFDARMNELTGASERWEAVKGWILDNFQTLLLIASAVLFPVFIAVVLMDHWDMEHPKPVGCKKLGASMPRNPGHESEQKEEKVNHISPIDGCQSIRIEDSDAVGINTDYDHRFGFVQLVPPQPGKQKDTAEKIDGSWVLITEKDFPRLSSLDVQLWIPDTSNRQYNAEWEVVKNGGCLIVSFPFSSNFAISSRYWDYLYSSAKAKYIRRSWSAKPVVTFEVPFLPTAQRMERKAYGLERNASVWTDTQTILDMAHEISPQVIGKLKEYLGVSNQLSLFRRYRSR